MALLPSTIKKIFLGRANMYFIVISRPADSCNHVIVLMET